MVETALKVELPRREDMQEIEISSRLYQDHEALFMTAPLSGRRATPSRSS